MAETQTKLTLYTNHGCPYAHRAHITLKELDLPYDEVIIDLDRPRDPWYLEVNPRGLVPSLKYAKGATKDEIITESAIVAQFLAESYPSHLLPTAGGPDPALTRARINFFTDTWNTKVASFLFGTLMAEDGEAKEAKVREWLAALGKEIEPLLETADPYFGGSKEFTLAEVHTAPFVLRWYSLAKAGLYPPSFLEGLDKLPNFSKWAKAVTSKESVTYIYKEDEIVARTKKRLADFKAKAKA